jgi:hypothetical protein
MSAGFYFFIVGLLHIGVMFHARRVSGFKQAMQEGKGGHAHTDDGRPIYT